MQGYLPIKMIVDALRAGKALPKSGFISSGAEVITKPRREGGPRPAALSMATDQGASRRTPPRRRRYYHQLFFGKGKFVNWQTHVEPIANASR